MAFSSDRSPRKFYDVHVVKHYPDGRLLIQVNYGSFKMVSQEQYDRILKFIDNGNVNQYTRIH